MAAIPRLLEDGSARNLETGAARNLEADSSSPPLTGGETDTEIVTIRRRRRL